MDKTGSLHILHIEDDKLDAELIHQMLSRSDLDCRISLAMSRAQYLDALRKGDVDVVLSDNRGYDFDGLEVLRTVQRHHPSIPFLFLSGSYEGKDLDMLKAQGAAECLLKSDLESIVPAIERALHAGIPSCDRYQQGMERLLAAALELALARESGAVMAIVCRAARELTGADGASIVLREGDTCHFAEEQAIAQLWNDRRLPSSACISGWAMLNHQGAVIEDIYSDPRIAAALYRSTFVKSLVVTPIHASDPFGTIENYWATQHRPDAAELKLLGTLAELAAAALESARSRADMQRRLRDRSLDLEALNKELQAFSYSVSHDLRGPLRSINGFGKLLAQDYADKLDSTGRGLLDYVTGGALRMSELIDALIELSRLARAPLVKERVNLSVLALGVMDGLQAGDAARRVEVQVAPELQAYGDVRQLRIIFEKLLGNAWKFTSKRAEPRIEVGVSQEDGESVFYVRDNGAGFDMAHADTLFTPFQRQHGRDEFEGIGTGLAAVQRIVARHGGRVWAQAAMGEGATFFFTVPGGG